MGSQIKRIVNFSFRTAVIIYTCIAVFYFLSRSVGGGDETLFINDLQLIFSEGWVAALKKGISIPYMLLVYPFSLFLKDYIALRLVSILIFLLLVWYFYTFRKIRNVNFYFFLLFFFNTTGYSMLGTNDMLFIAALAIYFAEVYFVMRSNKQEKLEILWLSLVIAMFTRALIMVYIPAILFSVYLLFRNRRNSPNSLFVPLIFFILFTALNMPSITENNRLSYDYKAPPSYSAASWVQLQYYAQVLVNEGKLENYNHPTWQETMTFLETEGPDSLPKSNLAALYHDPVLTLREFFKDFLDSLYLGTRQLALILPVLLIFGVHSLKKHGVLNSENLIPILLLMMLVIFSFITISFVELRWLAPVFIVSTLYYAILNIEGKIPGFAIYLNLGFMVLLSIYGSYGMLIKLY